MRTFGRGGARSSMLQTVRKSGSASPITKLRPGRILETGAAGTTDGEQRLEMVRRRVGVMAAAGVEGGTPVPWVKYAPPPPAAPVPAGAALAPPGSGVGVLPLQPSASSAGDGGAAGVGKPAAQAAEGTDKKQKKKLLKLLKRAKKGAASGHVQHALLKRVKKHMTKDRKSDHDDTSSTSSSVFRDASPLPEHESHGNKIVRLAQSAPGSLLESGVKEVAKFLQAKGGVDSEVADTLAPLMMTYFRSVWQGAHPASEVGLRNNAELEKLATVIDRLLEGNMAAVGDILMQRFRCVQLAGNRDDATLVPMEMREEALKAHRRDSKITEGLRKAKSS